MADFYQNGIITTLHNLSHRTVEEMESELVEFSRTRPMGLLLPSLYSELQGEALVSIVDKLKDVQYLSEIVIGLDRANVTEEELGTVSSMMRILCRAAGIEYKPHGSRKTPSTAV